MQKCKKAARVHGPLQSGTWRQENLPKEGLISISHTGSNKYAKSAKDVRDIYKEYFSSAAGAVFFIYNLIKIQLLRNYTTTQLRKITKNDATRRKEIHINPVAI